MTEIVNFVGIGLIMCTLLILAGWAENERKTLLCILFLVLSSFFIGWCWNSYDFVVNIYWGFK